MAGLLFLAVAVYFGYSYWSTEMVLRQQIASHRTYALVFGGLSVFCFVIWGIALKTNRRLTQDYDEIVSLREKGGNSTPIRDIEPVDTSKVLVEATVDEYHITYRRNKLTHELAVGSHVYAEMRGLVKTRHTLFAVLNGHLFEAGIAPDGDVFIKYDDDILEKITLLWL